MLTELEILNEIPSELRALVPSNLTLNEREILSESFWFNDFDPSYEPIIVPEWESLVRLLPITHPDWWFLFDSGLEEDLVKQDTRDGVSFLFFWNDGYLCWER